MQIVTKKKSKRRLKRGFKIILILIIFLSILIATFFTIKNGNIYPFNKKEEIKEFNQDIVEMNTDNNLDPFSKLFKLRLPSQRLEYFKSSEIAENGDMKIYLKNTNQDSGYLFVNTNDDPSFVWITFVSAIAGEPLKSSLTNNLKNLDYIDLRFKNKVFYKFENKSISTNNTDNNSSTTSTSIR